MYTVFALMQMQYCPVLRVQVCQEQGVPVQLQAPRLLDVDSWQGAFISSTSRLLLPACEVQYTDQAGQARTKVRGHGGATPTHHGRAQRLSLLAVLGQPTGSLVVSVLVNDAPASASAAAPAAAVGVQVFAQQHPVVLKLEAGVTAKVLSCSEPLDSKNTQSID